MPVEVAVGATALAHLPNNLFKLALVGRQANARVLLCFAVPAALAAIPGASPLVRLSDLPTITTWAVFGNEYRIESCRWPSAP
ncbi:MAG: hypothetical protein ACFCUR_13590 [Rhodomicrobiaceae bacterium]